MTGSVSRGRGLRCEENCGLETAVSAPVSAHGVQGARPCPVFIAGTSEADDNCIRREAGWRAIVGRRPVRRRRTRFGQRLLTRLLAMREVWACLTQRDALRSYPVGASLSRRPGDQRAKGTTVEPRVVGDGMVKPTRVREAGRAARVTRPLCSSQNVVVVLKRP